MTGVVIWYLLVRLKALARNYKSRLVYHKNKT